MKYINPKGKIEKSYEINRLIRRFFKCIKFFNLMLLLKDKIN